MLAKRTAERVLNTYTPVFIERIANGKAEGDITKVIPEVFDAVEGEYSRVLSDLLERERKRWLKFFKENPVEKEVNIDPFIGQIAYLSVDDYSRFWDDVRNLILGKEIENKEHEYGILCGIAGNLLLTFSNNLKIIEERLGKIVKLFNEGEFMQSSFDNTAIIYANHQAYLFERLLFRPHFLKVDLMVKALEKENIPLAFFPRRNSALDEWILNNPTLKDSKELFKKEWFRLLRCCGRPEVYIALLSIGLKDKLPTLENYIAGIEQDREFNHFAGRDLPVYVSVKDLLSLFVTNVESLEAYIVLYKKGYLDISEGFVTTVIPVKASVFALEEKNNGIEQVKKTLDRIAKIAIENLAEKELEIVISFIHRFTNNCEFFYGIASLLDQELEVSSGTHQEIAYALEYLKKKLIELKPELRKKSNSLAELLKS